MLIDEILDQASEIVRDKMLRKQEKCIKFFKKVAAKDTTFEVKSDMLMRFVEADHIYFGSDMQR